MTDGKPSQELSVESILSRAFNLFGSKFLQFFVPFLISGIILGTCAYVLNSYFPIPEPPEMPTTPDPTFVYEVLGPWIISLISTMVVLIGVSGSLSWIMNSIVYGIATKTTSDQIETGTSTLGTSFNYTLSKLPTLLAAQFIAGILIAAGLLLFIVPGIIIAIMFSLIVPAVVVEEKGVFESLGRSRQLVHQRWGNTFVIMLVCGLIVSAPLGIINVASSVLGVANPAVTMVVGYVFTAFFGSILPIALTYLYYSMVARETSPPPPIY
ncbi:MAG: hypothetical protein CW716_06760 [Candidatus Bathyarchaeum sp.]|nr:MAG: hypothetical protein CW716_06760 [Candidatus Bathyarchaeum sp.]